MKITIIGGGNMGGAIARGLIDKGVMAPGDMTVADPSDKVLENFRLFNPHIRLSADNREAVKGADLVIVAVKPWLMEQILSDIGPVFDTSKQMLASIAAGVTFENLSGYLGCGSPAVLFRIIPNTAIALAQSTTFISHWGASEGQLHTVRSLFESLGEVFVIEEKEMTAATALASCGIAYALRYIDAAAKGGDALGIAYPDSLRIVMQTVKGALSLLEANDSLPQQEIDKVTTPGGITLKGLEEMERNGFSQTVIKGLEASK